jgi:hypothetical protein
LKHAIIACEGFSKLIGFSSFISFSLFDMLFATDGALEHNLFFGPFVNPFGFFALMA